VGVNVHTVLPEISHGDHCCLLFSSRAEQIALTVPFLALGIERGERALFVGDADAIEHVRAGLRSAGVGVDHEIDKGRLAFEVTREYLDQGRFNTDKMLSFLQQGYEATIAQGFTALRAVGDVAWQVGAERDFRDVVYYETLLDVFFLGKRMVGMCQYPREKCPPEVLVGILGTHKVTAIDSEVCSNFHYVPPAVLLEKDEQVRHEKRVEWMSSQLLRARRAEEEVLRLNADLERRVAERTAELQDAYRDMEAFSYSVSHDLRAPLRAIDGFSAVLADEQGQRLDDEGRRHLERIRHNAQRMSTLIEDLLRFSRVGRQGLSLAEVDMTALARGVAEEVGGTIQIADLPPARGDASLLRQVLVNLLGNAVKFTRDRAAPRIEVGARIEPDGVAYFVRDNGAGFDMAFASRLFSPFQRLHGPEQFEGTGIGLAIAQRVVRRHDGRIWAEGRVDEGATFYFMLGAPSAPTR
jgi:signal transduction histidine kinase